MGIRLPREAAQTASLHRVFWKNGNRCQNVQSRCAGVFLDTSGTWKRRRESLEDSLREGVRRTPAVNSGLDRSSDHAVAIQPALRRLLPLSVVQNVPAPHYLYITGEMTVRDVKSKSRNNALEIQLQAVQPRVVLIVPAERTSRACHRSASVMSVTSSSSSIPASAFPLPDDGCKPYFLSIL